MTKCYLKWKMDVTRLSQNSQIVNITDLQLSQRLVKFVTIHVPRMEHNKMATVQYELTSSLLSTAP